MLETIACYAIVSKKGTLRALAHLRAALSSTARLSRAQQRPLLGVGCSRLLSAVAEVAMPDKPSTYSPLF